MLLGWPYCCTSHAACSSPSSDALFVGAGTCRSSHIFCASFQHLLPLPPGLPLMPSTNTSLAALPSRPLSGRPELHRPQPGGLAPRWRCPAGRPGHRGRYSAVRAHELGGCLLAGGAAHRRRKPGGLQQERWVPHGLPRVRARPAACPAAVAIVQPAVFLPFHAAPRFGRAAFGGRMALVCGSCCRLLWWRQALPQAVAGGRAATFSKHWPSAADPS